MPGNFRKGFGGLVDDLVGQGGADGEGTVSWFSSIFTG